MPCPVDHMSTLGSSLIDGHAQTPSGMRAIAGGLFTGCAGAVVARLDG